MAGFTATAAVAVAAAATAAAAAMGTTGSHSSPGIPLSRENSSSRDSMNTNTGSSISRFSVEKEKDGSNPINSPSPQMAVSQGRRSDERDRDGIETPSCGVGKRGRFESESIGGSSSTSPSSSLSRGQSLQIEIGHGNPLCSQLETLIQQNQLQYALLSDLFHSVGGAPKSGGSMVSQTTFPGNNSSIHSGQSLYGGHWGSIHVGEKKDALLPNGARNPTQDELSVQNANLLREIDLLKDLLKKEQYLSLIRESDLKKEIERLRRSLSATSINVAGGATSNAASVDAATPYPILVNPISKSSSNLGVTPPLSMPALPTSVKFEERPKENIVKFEERKDP